MQRHRLSSLALLAIIASIVGCSSSTVTVEGQATLNGKPLPDASIVFVPIKPTGGRSMGSQTDAEGRFRVEGDPGLQPGGTYFVRIKAFDKNDVFNRKGFPVRLDLIPERYNQPQGRLEVTMPESTSATFSHDVTITCSPQEAAALKRKQRSG